MERIKCCLGVLFALLFMGAQPVMAQHAITLDHANTVQVTPWVEYDFTEAGEAEETASAEQRRRQQEQDRRRARGSAMVHLLGIYGSQWFHDDQDPDRTAAATTRGVGARLVHISNRWFAFEVETTYINSDRARFEDTRRYRVQGELSRDISLFRALGGTVLRFTNGNLIPLVRAGVGFQQALVDTRLRAGGQEQGALDIAKVFDLAWYAGGGVDLRLGHIDAGLRISAMAPAISFASELLGTGSVEAEFHLGYSWPP